MEESNQTPLNNPIQQVSQNKKRSIKKPLLKMLIGFILGNIGWMIGITAFAASGDNVLPMLMLYGGFALAIVGAIVLIVGLVGLIKFALGK